MQFNQVFMYNENYSQNLKNYDDYNTSVTFDIDKVYLFCHIQVLICIEYTFNNGRKFPSA